jgi:hypothetical protein
VSLAAGAAWIRAILLCLANRLDAKIGAVAAESMQSMGKQRNSRKIGVVADSSNGGWPGSMLGVDTLVWFDEAPWVRVGLIHNLAHNCSPGVFF